MKRTYNEFYHIYEKVDYHQIVRPEKVITEDSNSGFQFFQGVCKNNGRITCISANGKSNIFAAVVKQSDEKMLVIADGAAFGSEMDKLMRLIKDNPNVTLYLPESFEWLILKSGLIEDGSIVEILEQPQNYIESKNYFSWERYFTEQLIRKTQDSYLKYAKGKLNSVYLQDKVAEKILAVMKGIELT